MIRVIQYYDENLDLTSNKYKICWMLNSEIVDEHTKIQRLYEISAKTLKEYALYREENMGGNYYQIDRNNTDFMAENAIICNESAGMTIRNDYNILEISARNNNGDYEGIQNVYRLNGVKISEKLWYKDRLIKDYYDYRNNNIVEKKKTVFLNLQLNVVKERKYAVFKKESLIYEIKINNTTNEIKIEKLYYLETKKLIEKKTFVNGKLYGISENYDKNGNIILRGAYLNGKKIGLWHEYENGKVVFKAAFDEEERFCGLCKEYDLNGKVLAEEIYIKGNLIKRMEK